MKLCVIAVFLLIPVTALRSDNTERHHQSRNLQATCVQCREIEVIFHILGNVAKTNDAATMWPDERFVREINTLNSLWSKTPFKFKLRSSTRQSNDNWAFGDVFSPTFTTEVVSALRVGGRATANVFVNDGPVCSTGGFARAAITQQFFPVDQFSSNDYIFLCGGVDDKNLVTHEFGHWLSLAHTFEGNSCDPNNPGDGVADTTQQGAPSDGICDPTQDTCPNSPGLDPIYNYMDYSSCEEKTFTSGQILKMYDFFMDNRSSIKICKSTQYKLGFDIKYDSNPSQNALSYTTWGDSSRQTFAPIENSEKINFANKQVLGYKCVDRFSLYQVTLTDSGNDGIQAPGYFAFTADGKDLARGNVPARSYLFSIDAQCPAKESRLRLELAFGDFPADIEWKILDANDKTVIDHTATTGKGFTQYIPNFAGLTLIFEKCLAAGPYKFRIENTYGDTDLAPGFYKLILNSQQIKFSNALSTNPEDTSFTVKAKVIACFSGDSLVEVLEKGEVRMKDLILGDKVHVGNDVFEPVYSFGHRNSNVKADYLRVRTERTTIVISEDHMIFSDTGNAIAARLLKVGNKLLHGSGDVLTVQDIAVISAEGAYAPFTPSGKIVVNAVVASSFVAFGNGSTMNMAGFRFSFHWLAHTFETPHRLYCTYVSNCKSETYNDNGISYWVDIPHQIAVWIFSQKGTMHSFLKLLIVICLLALFLIKLLTQNLFILILAAIAFMKMSPAERKKE